MAILAITNGEQPWDFNINKQVLLAVCGGIAAYKSAELIRLLRKQNCEVRVVMTQSALQFVSPLTFQALSGNPVHTELLGIEEENAMGHINLARWADVLVIAPATANTVAKCALGLSDNLVTALVLTATCPIYIAPAMNQAMWGKGITQSNISKLKAVGINFIGPNSGEQACGETGMGRMAEANEICRRVLSLPTNTALAGLRVVVTAGPTREYIDPVRYITNRSSGKMGYAVASAAKQAGAHVTLISGPVNLASPVGVDLIHVESAAQMYDAVMVNTKAADIFISAAAVADYSPTLVTTKKLKKTEDKLNVSLQKTKDILAEVAKLNNAPFTVGFAAETHDLASYALDKLQNKHLDMIAANWVGLEQGGFDSNQNALEVFWEEHHTSLPMAPKSELAKNLIQLITTRFNEKNSR